MNRLIVFYSFWLLSTSIQAQNLENKLIENLQSNHLSIEVDHSQVTVITWDEPFIKIMSSVSINGDEENDKHNLMVKNNNSGIKVHSKIQYNNLTKMLISTNEKGETVSQPLNDFDKITNNGLHNELHFGYDIVGELKIFVPIDMTVDVTATYGDLKVLGEFQSLQGHSTYGLIEADLTGLNGMESLYLKSTYDIVDLTIEESSNAHLSLNTTYGEVFTDLPINFEGGKLLDKENGKCKSGRYVLNGGDLEVNISATYSNIYLRKSN